MLSLIDKFDVIFLSYIQTKSNFVWGPVRVLQKKALLNISQVITGIFKVFKMVQLFLL